MCPPEKGRQIDGIRSRVVRSLQSALRTKYHEIRACFGYFAVEGGAVSLQFRLAGGAGSLALTFLCPNSLLTGNLTGNLANSGALKPHFLSLSCTFQKETSGSGISPSREFAGMYQGIGFSYQRMSCSEARCGGRTPETRVSIDPGTYAGHAFLPERIPTAHAARPSSRECHDTTSQSSGREAGDPRG